MFRIKLTLITLIALQQLFLYGRADKIKELNFPNDDNYYLKLFITMIDSETIQIETHLDKNCGHIALKFGPDISGNDLVVWQRETDWRGNQLGTVRDYWSEDEEEMIKDTKQDWTLVSHLMTQLEDGTEYDIFISRRALNTGDE